MKFRSLAVLAALFFAVAARAQTTLFTYQGQLNSGGSPANGFYDFRFQLLDTNSNPAGFAITNAPVGVTNGAFITTLNFSSLVFDGSDRFLQIGVRTNGSADAYTVLTPAQQITSAPYSIRALFASSALALTVPVAGTNLTGTIPTTNLPANVAFVNSNQIFSGVNNFSNAVTATNAANIFAGNAFGLTNLQATNLTGTILDARLSANVGLQSNPNLNFAGNVAATNFSGGGHGLTNVPGAFFWTIVSGTNITAQPNVGYVCTNNFYPVTVLLPKSPSVGDTFKVAGAGGGGWIVAQTNGQTILSGNLSANTGNSWTARDSSRAWTGIASSADGTKLVACVQSGSIYTSTNSGATWTQSGAGSLDWSAVASSADGTKLAATVGDISSDAGTIYVNGNSGLGTWNSEATSHQWVSIASSADGTKLIAAAYDSGIYVSQNSGVSWSVAASLQFCASVTSSEDGTKLAAAVFSGLDQGIVTSTNSGLSWQLRTNIANGISIASSADGSHLVVAAGGTTMTGQIYVSADGGATWSGNSISKKWTGVASSADGSRLAAVSNDGSIYTSSNFGGTWISRGVPVQYWTGIASSASGGNLAATASTGQIYTSGQSSTTTGTAGYLFGAQQSAIELIYIGNGIFMPLDHEGSISAY